MGHATTLKDAAGGWYALCTECPFYGPTRETWDAAQADQDAHVVETQREGGQDMVGKPPPDGGSYTGPFVVEIKTSDGWLPAISGVRQLPLRCEDRQSAYERALKIIHSGREARVIEPPVNTTETFKTQSAAAMAVSDHMGAHVSRSGLVTSLDRYTIYGRVQKVAPGRWVIAERSDRV